MGVMCDYLKEDREVIVSEWFVGRVRALQGVYGWCFGDA